MVRSLQARQSLLVLGSSGSGKSTLARQLWKELPKHGLRGILLERTTPKIFLQEVAEAIGVDLRDENDKRKLLEQLQEDIADRLRGTNRVLLIDNSKNLPRTLRDWLAMQLPDRQRNLKGCLQVHFATSVPNESVYSRLPEPLYLEALAPWQIRQLLTNEADRAGLKLSRADLASLQAGIGGLPGAAIAAIAGERSGTRREVSASAEHIDLTPVVMLVPLFFLWQRITGMGTNPNAYAFGMFGYLLSMRLLGLFRAMPKKQRRL